MPRIIFHVDMDAFFTACEARQKPALKGKPLIVGADPKYGHGRGVVSAASYETRAFGVHSGMPVSQAYRLCPAAVFLPVNFHLYWNVSDKIMQILRKYAIKFQQTSIDEAFLDMTGKAKDFDEARSIALLVKKEILEKEKLTCSIGIAPNKLVAKMASDINKPNGITVVEAGEVKNFLFLLPVGKLYGIGKKTEAVLNDTGIETIGDLAKSDVQVLQDQFGKFGLYMHSYANGIDESEVEEEFGIQSLGREVTFDEDTNDILLLNEMLDKIAEEVYSSLIETGYSFRTVTLKLRYENFETHTHQKTFPRTLADLNLIKDTAKELLAYFIESKKKIRLIGLRLSNLKTTEGQKSLKAFYPAKT
ncbi:MAG: DNA polymerase IV [Candidatus Aenigmarchaeota archaeon]|nr:DNA polymerase IV [Candidatus Aenigmarchaeota archaeon]